VTLLLGISAFLIVQEPCMVLRNSPDNTGAIEDVVRYGTKVTVTQEQGNWVHVSYANDHGWTSKEKLIEVTQDPDECATAWVSYRGAYLFTEADTEKGPFLALPFETPLEIIEELPEAHRRWLLVRLADGRTGYVQRSQVVFAKKQLTLAEMVAFSHNFLGTKYLWGGSTSFGYDCSGFVGMLYRQMGVELPRNSKDQWADQRFVEVDKPQAGDLVFFRNAKGKVVHVGMMVSDEQFIHAFTREESWICLSSWEDDRFHNGHFYYRAEVKRLR
jgi:gamma-D-glutamyl-L-lysine dipeptidyl-peptidase